MSISAKSASQSPGERSKGPVGTSQKAQSDKEEYAEYVLDMVTHNLFSTGQVEASKVHLLRTPELTKHILKTFETASVTTKAKILEKVEGMGNSLSHERDELLMKLAGASYSGKKASKKPKGKKWALQPNSLPITIITDKNPEQVKKHGGKLTPNASKNPKGATVSLNSAVKFNKIPRAETKAAKTRANIKSKPKSSITQNKIVPTTPVKIEKFKEVKPLPFTEVKNIIKRSVSQSPLPHRHTNPEAINSITPTQAKSNLNMPVNPTPILMKPKVNKKANAQAFRVHLDMKGFRNEEISLDLDERRLTVTGIRTKRNELNARKVTETIDIPEGINVEHLKVARRADGALVIEETVPDIDSIL